MQRNESYSGSSDSSDLGMLPFFRRATQHDGRIAIACSGREYTYAELLAASGHVVDYLLRDCEDLGEQRVAFLVPPGFEYVAVQWGVWRAGGIAVPLATSHPPPELDYVLGDATPSVVISHPLYSAKLQPLAQQRGITFTTTDEIHSPSPAPSVAPFVSPKRRALILYTSGTTGKPKGVVTTHANIEAQVTSLVSAWEWTEADRALLVLPVHHVHGIINVLACALWSGAVCDVLTPFDAEAVWNRFAERRLTVFMAVPTIYHRLVLAWEGASPERRRLLTEAGRAFRLMVSGSAALPISTLNRWRDITGQELLERYGMTEIGMALSNPLHGTRVPGRVGTPLPGVEVKLVDETGTEVGAGRPGQIMVRGPAVFREYWNDPAATKAAFAGDWFATGDTATSENGTYRILGRTSVDIIKTGGYKVSALEIEEVLRTHPHIVECAVVGTPDDEWGERVCVAAEVSGEAITPDAVREWARDRLAPYKIPKEFRTVRSLPRNAMGKVMKPQIIQMFTETRESKRT